MTGKPSSSFPHLQGSWTEINRVLLGDSSEVREAEGWWGDRWMGTGAGMALGDPGGGVAGSLVKGMRRK